MRKTTEQLQVGDTLTVWWPPGRDTLLSLTPYQGSLSCLKGALTAEFALLPSRFMTLEAAAVWKIWEDKP